MEANIHIIREYLRRYKYLKVFLRKKHDLDGYRGAGPLIAG